VTTAVRAGAGAAGDAGTVFGVKAAGCAAMGVAAAVLLVPEATAGAGAVLTEPVATGSDVRSGAAMLAAGEVAGAENLCATTTPKIDKKATIASAHPTTANRMISHPYARPQLTNHKEAIGPQVKPKAM
jgi:hypothetical protein